MRIGKMDKRTEISNAGNALLARVSAVSSEIYKMNVSSEFVTANASALLLTAGFSYAAKFSTIPGAPKLGSLFILLGLGTLAFTCIKKRDPNVQDCCPGC